MNVTNAMALLSWVLPLLGGTVYWAVRMAIRAEVSSLELRIGEKYVDKETCKAIREDCDRYRRAKEQRGEA